MKRVYHKPERLSRAELEMALKHADAFCVASALISAALYDADRNWVEQRALELLETSPDCTIRAAAITAFGHLARIHAAITTCTVLPALESALEHPQLASYASDSLSDIRWFVFGEDGDEADDPDLTA